MGLFSFLTKTSYHEIMVIPLFFAFACIQDKYSVLTKLNVGFLSDTKWGLSSLYYIVWGEQIFYIFVLVYRFISGVMTSVSET